MHQDLQGDQVDLRIQGAQTDQVTLEDPGPLVDQEVPALLLYIQLVKKMQVHQEGQVDHLDQDLQEGHLYQEILALPLVPGSQERLEILCLPSYQGHQDHQQGPELLENRYLLSDRVDQADRVCRDYLSVPSRRHFLGARGGPLAQVHLLFQAVREVLDSL